MTQAKPKVILVGPTPPPVHGVSQVVAWLVASPTLADGLRILHLDTSDRRSYENLGRVDVRNVLIGLKNVVDMVRLCVRQKPSVMYYTLSQNTPALLRDAALVAAASLFRVRPVVQLAGSRYCEIEAVGGVASALVRRALEKARLILVLGESQVPSVLGIVSHHRIAVVPNGLPDPADHSPKEVRPGPCRFLYLGPLILNKGVVVALEAMGSMSEDQGEFAATFAGSWTSEDQRRQIMAAVERLGLSSVVRFPGVVRGEQKAQLFKEADVYLLPSFAEGQPVSIIEAMAYSLPVISTRVGGIPDTVADGQTGILVQPGEATSLADAMRRLMDDADARTSMGKAGRDRYLQNFTLERSHELLRDSLILAARA